MDLTAAGISDLTDPDGWIDAWRFAASMHVEQKVPGSNLPYIYHVGAVVMELFAAHTAQSVDNIDLAIKCAALHDTQEDQGVSYETLCARFGEAVARGVGALSKDPALPKAEAMADSLARIRQQPTAIWCVKMADRIVNLAAPPAHWSPDKIDAYRRGAALILTELGEAHAALAERLAEKIKLYPPAA